MRQRRPITAALWLAAAMWIAAHSAVAASFDCDRARGKLNRVICSDAELSRLDEEVWNAYGERIKSLSPAQYAHARARHVAWRRARGIYETAVAPLLHEYRAQLAWLRHPLLPLEGRYLREGDGELARIEAEVDTRSPDALDLRGFSGDRRILAWFVQGPAYGAANAAMPDTRTPQQSGAAATARVDAGGTRFIPDFAGTPVLPLGACEFDLRFGDDRLTLRAAGDCGADFSGTYRKVARD